MLRAEKYTRGHSRARRLGAVRRVGLGDTLSDFESELQSDPSGFGRAWAPVQAQLTGEGAGTTLLNVAKTNFITSYNALTSSNGALTQGDVGAALNAAQQYILQGGTIAGAAKNISGLVAAVESGVPSAIVSSVTGTMIGLEAIAVTSGALTAGVGAIIVVGLELAAALFGTGGLFSTGTPGVTVGTCTVSPAPSYTIGGCFPTLDPGPVKAGPQGSKWRKFPVPSSPNDAPWFQPNVTAFQWTTGFGVNEAWSVCGTGGYRPIDTAIHEYHQLECELLWTQTQNLAAEYAAMPSGMSLEQQVAYAQFERAFIAAWKANAEYAINGLARQPDYVVLLHTLHLWNAAHAPGVGYEIAPVGGPYYPNPVTAVLDPLAPCSGAVPTFYSAMLVNDVLNAVSGAAGTDDAITNQATLHLNTGPMNTVPLIANLNNAVGTNAATNAQASSASSSAAGMSTAGKVATTVAVAGGLAIAGSALYAHETRQSLSALWRGWYNAARKKI